MLPTFDSLPLFPLVAPFSLSYGTLLISPYDPMLDLRKLSLGRRGEEEEETTAAAEAESESAEETERKCLCSSLSVLSAPPLVIAIPIAFSFCIVLLLFLPLVVVVAAAAAPFAAAAFLLSAASIIAVAIARAGVRVCNKQSMARSTKLPRLTDKEERDKEEEEVGEESELPRILLLPPPLTPLLLKFPLLIPCLIFHSHLGSISLMLSGISSALLLLLESPS